jgi:hypothetical protein|tara:strand:+ start:504 stop:611 length:108 start_codon:yes stop_codon:yes gene_type:complete
MSYKLLEENNWNFQAVSNNLRVQRQKQEQEDAEKE